MDIKWEWIIIVACDAAVAVVVVVDDVAAATSAALVFTKLTESVYLMYESSEMNQKRCTQTDKSIHEMSKHHTLHVQTQYTPTARPSTIDKFIWRAFFSLHQWNFIASFVFFRPQCVGVCLRVSIYMAVCVCECKHTQAQISNKVKLLIILILFFASYTRLELRTWDDGMRDSD